MVKAFRKFVHSVRKNNKHDYPKDSKSKLLNFIILKCPVVLTFFSCFNVKWFKVIFSYFHQNLHAVSENFGKLWKFQNCGLDFRFIFEVVVPCQESFLKPELGLWSILSALNFVNRYERIFAGKITPSDPNCVHKLLPSCFDKISLPKWKYTKPKS